MRLSPSLIRALKAVEKVLTAESDDLGELAKIAAEASGIPADRILLRMDLEGLDLREREVSYLLDKETHYHGAILTQAQRQSFDRASRENARRQVRMKVRSIRVGMISDFINAYESRDSPLVDVTGEQLLTVNHLRELMLAPVNERYLGDTPLDARYPRDVLVGLQAWAKQDNASFFIALFKLIGDLRCPIDRSFVTALDASYRNQFGPMLGTMIAQMPPTALLDCFWILRDGQSIQANARQLSEIRLVHPRAIEETLDQISGTSARITFLEMIRFECSNDEAERIATRISRADWPASETQTVLRAKTYPRVRSAIFRQILMQGDERRVIEVLRWLDDNRGAVGALSLEDAFRNIQSFDVGIVFAEEAGSRFADNQIKVIYLALRDLAATDADRQRLERFRARMNYTPPSEPSAAGHTPPLLGSDGNQRQDL